MALTAQQIAALQTGTAEAKLAVEIDATTPLRYCSPHDPVQVGSDWYEPRAVYGSVFALVSPSRAKTRITIDDRDRALTNAWYADRFSGYDVTVHVLLREPPSTTWVTATSITWECERGTPRGGDMILYLHAAGGHRRKFGLTVGSLSLFPRAPLAGEVFSFYEISTTIRQPTLAAQQPEQDDERARVVSRSATTPVVSRQQPVSKLPTPNKPTGRRSV